MRMVWEPWSAHCFLVLLVMVSMVITVVSDFTDCPHGCMCSETIIDCRHSNLTSLPDNLPKASSVQQFLFSGNRIKHIGIEIGKYTSLQKFDVASNNISDIENGAFASMSRLACLILRRNYLARVTNETFQGLKDLMSLDLGYNLLKMLPDDVYADLGNLQHLDLMKNNISVIKENAFRGLGSLQVLNLTRNLLAIYPTAALSKLSSLTRLVLDDNKLVTIPKFAFSGMVKLKFLSLNGNHLASMDPSAFALKPYGLANPLLELSLKGTDLAEVPVKALENLSNLKVLDISKNSFRVFRRGDFAEMSDLQKLTVMSSKYLTSIEDGAFGPMSRLKELIIRNNKNLVTVGKLAFPYSPYMEILDLSSNSVRTFYANMADWDQNVTVDLRDNRIHCDCNMAWMIATLRNATSYKTRLYAANLTCAAPAQYAGSTILSLPESEFQCAVASARTYNALTRVKVAAIAAAIASVVLICCALLVKFRKQICVALRRQYRYRHYKSNKNGVFTVNGVNGDLHEEGTPMEVIRSYKDDPDIQVQD